MNKKIKKGITVIVLTGKDKGKKGQVLRAFQDKVLVEGINIQTHHEKPRSTRQTSGGNTIQHRPGPIHISNVKAISPEE